MTKTRFGIWSALVALAASATMVACGGGGDSGTAAPAMGTLRVALTDAPQCRVDNEELDKVYVTVERIRVHQSADAGEMGGGWTDIAVSPPRKINLLDLNNGRLEELGSTPIPAGNYTQVRLVLSGGNLSPSMRFVGQDEIPLRTPSAMQSGLKIIRPFTVQPNTLVDLVIDFDACRSIVSMGNGGYALKPTLTAATRTVAGIVGFVDPTLTDVTVSAQQDGKVIRSTVPFATANGMYAAGEFVLAYLDTSTGPYVVVVTSPTRGTSVVTDVTVSTSAVTRVSTAQQPIPLPAAGTPAFRTVSGKVDPQAAQDDGVVRAIQVVGSLPKVEVAAVNVNGTDGSYTLQLPTALPKLAPYGGLPLTFADQPSPTPEYTVEASATGYVTATKALGTFPADVLWSPTLNPAP